MPLNLSFARRPQRCGGQLRLLFGSSRRHCLCVVCAEFRCFALCPALEWSWNDSCARQNVALGLELPRTRPEPLATSGQLRGRSLTAYKSSLKLKHAIRDQGCHTSNYGISCGVAPPAAVCAHRTPRALASTECICPAAARRSGLLHSAGPVTRHAPQFRILQRGGGKGRWRVQCNVFQSTIVLRDCMSQRAGSGL